MQYTVISGEQQHFITADTPKTAASLFVEKIRGASIAGLGALIYVLDDEYKQYLFSTIEIVDAIGLLTTNQPAKSGGE